MQSTLLTDGIGLNWIGLGSVVPSLLPRCAAVVVKARVGRGRGRRLLGERATGEEARLAQSSSSDARNQHYRFLGDRCLCGVVEMMSPTHRFGLVI